MKRTTQETIRLEAEIAANRNGLTVDQIKEAMSRIGTAQESKADRDMLRVVTPEQRRPCGECNMCCVAPAIEPHVIEKGEDFSPKPACVACKFSNGKSGCSVYENRPSICKDYQCLWAMGMIAARHYPMKRGVAWTLQPDNVNGGTLVVGHCLDVDAVLEDKYNVEVISGYVAMTPHITGVTVRDSKKAVCFMAEGIGASAMIDQSDEMKMRVLNFTEKQFDYSFR